MIRKATWTKTEEQFIIDNYKNMTYAEIAEHLPRRSEKAVGRKLEELRKLGKVDYLTSEDSKRKVRAKRRMPNSHILNGGFVGVPSDYEDVDDYIDSYEECPDDDDDDSYIDYGDFHDA